MVRGVRAGFFVPTASREEHPPGALRLAGYALLQRRVYPPLSMSCLPGFDPDSIIVSTRRHMDLAKLIPRTVRTCFDNLAVSHGCLVLTHHAPFARGASSSSSRRTFLPPTPPPPPPPPHKPGMPPMPSRAAPVPAGAAASGGREHQWAHAAAVSHGVLPPWSVCICHPTVLQVPGPGDLPTSSGEPCVLYGANFLLSYLIACHRLMFSAFMALVFVQDMNRVLKPAVLAASNVSA